MRGDMSVLARLMMAAAMVVGLAVQPAAAQDAQRKKVIVCSTTQIYDFAKQVVGDRWEVQRILAPGADPHLYEPRPGDARKVAAADLCLQNGLNLEGHAWMKRLAEDAGKPIVNCTDGITLLELEGGDEPVPDPHAWFDPTNAAVYVNNILAAVRQLDPEHAEEYNARAALYLTQLRALHLWAQQQAARVPAEKRILVTSHDAFNYFCQAYGFKAAAPVGWSTGEEVGGGMTPERRKMVVESIQSFNVPAIFVETSVNPKVIQQLAIDARVAIGGELYSDSMGPEGSAGETYIGMMRENVLTIVQALGAQDDTE